MPEYRGGPIVLPGAARNLAGDTPRRELKQIVCWISLVQNAADGLTK